MLKVKLKIVYYLYKRITFIIPFLCNQSRDKTLKMTNIDMQITRKTVHLAKIRLIYAKSYIRHL